MKSKLAVHDAIPIYLIVVVALSYCAFIWLEKPGTKLLRRFVNLASERWAYDAPKRSEMS